MIIVASGASGHPRENRPLCEIPYSCASSKFAPFVLLLTTFALISLIKLTARQDFHRSQHGEVYDLDNKRR